MDVLIFSMWLMGKSTYYNLDHKYKQNVNSNQKEKEKDKRKQLFEHHILVVGL